MKKITLKKYFKDQKPPNLEELIKNNQKFTDSYFPPNNNSLVSKTNDGKFVDEVLGPQQLKDMEEENPGSSKRLQWKRVTEVHEKWELFEGKIEFNDVLQGDIGDCYFLTSITALTQYPKLIEKIFITKMFNKEGYYEMKFFIDGEWQIVFVDDYFPFEPRTKTWAYARPNNYELWAMLLEKGWAKINGGYSNIIGGDVSDPIFSLTGFPTDFLLHSEYEEDELFQKIEGDSLNDGKIMSSASKVNEKIEQRGLVMGHAYTLIKAKAYKERKIYLLQLRNPWGEKEWCGSWSDNSKKWTDEYKKYFGHANKDDGIFWIDIEDYMLNFDGTYICYILYGALIKNYYFEYEKYFKYPIVFNLQINEKSKCYFSILFKNWRFNRDIHDVIHPVSMVLCKYDKNKKIEKLYSKWNSKDNINFIEELDKGYYVLWLYCAYDGVENDKNFKYTLQVTCLNKFNIEMIGFDKQFLFIQHLILENYKIIGATNLNSSKDYFLGNDKILNKSGINTLLMYNQSNIWYEFQVNAKNVKNISLLPPYSGLSQMKITIPPGQSAAIIGIRLNNKATGFSFGFQINPMNIKKEIPKENNFDIFLNTDFKGINVENDIENIRKADYKIISIEKAKDMNISYVNFVNVGKIVGDYYENKKQNNKIENNKNKLNIDSLKKEYPYEMKILLEQFSTEDFKNQNENWEKTQEKEGINIGQFECIEDDIKSRGFFIWNEYDMKYIGLYTNGKFGPKGLLLTKDNKTIYDGEFKEGKKDGKGKLFFNNNEIYTGDFKNDCMEGNGVYQFKNGDLWEGVFKNNMKNSVGFLTIKATNEKYLVEYENDHFMGKFNLNEMEKNIIDKMKKEEKEKNEKKQEETNKKKKGFFLNMFKDFISQKVQNYITNLFEEKNKIQASVLVQPAEKPIVETPEEIAHKKYLETIKKLNKEEPFMLNEVLKLPSLKGQEENIVLIENKDGSKYIGSINNNRNKHGRGAYFFNNFYYIGNFNNDKPSGFFLKYNNNKKIIFKGTLDNNYRITNNGVIYYPNGDRYEGNFLNDQLNGFGTYYFKKGDSWTGNFTNGQFNGIGKYFYENGLLSEIIEYNMNQVVKKNFIQIEDYSSPDANSFFQYISQTYPNVIEKLLLFPPMRDAPGSLKWNIFNFPDGNVYIGQTLLDNTFCGRCCFIYKNSVITYYIGYIKNQQFFKQGSYYDSKWNLIYEGTFKNNLRHGFGRLRTNEGNLYIGQFKNDLPNGKGVYYFPNEARYEGTFLNGEKNDEGVLIDKELKTKQSVLYKQGNIIEQGDIIECNKSSYKKKNLEGFKTILEKYKDYCRLFLNLAPTKDHLVLNMGIKEDLNGFYIGEMNSVGFKHGRGVLIEPYDKTFYAGYFYNNAKEGEGIIYYEMNKPKYIGNFYRNKPFGKGKYFYQSGEILEGNFNSTGQGAGVYTFADGSCWKGTFYAWNLNGVGEYFTKEGISMGNIRYNLNNFIGNN